MLCDARARVLLLLPFFFFAAAGSDHRAHYAALPRCRASLSRRRVAPDCAAMGRATRILIPGRFLTTMLHFIVVRVVLTVREAAANGAARARTPSLTAAARAATRSQVVLALYSINASVAASVSSWWSWRDAVDWSGDAGGVSEDAAAAASSCAAALGLSIACLAVCFAGLFGGWTLMFDRYALRFQHARVQCEGLARRAADLRAPPPRRRPAQPQLPALPLAL